jgi:hypothetical protein
MKKLLFIIASTVFASSIVNAQELGFFNGKGEDLTLELYDESFVECLTPENGGTSSGKYLLPKSTVTFFKYNESLSNCNQEMLFKVITNATQTSDMLGYTSSQPLRSRLSYKLVKMGDFIYPSKDLDHLDGLVISIGNSK